MDFTALCIEAISSIFCSASAINAINDKFSSYATIAYVKQEINNVYSYVNSRLSWDVI